MHSSPNPLGSLRVGTQREKGRSCQEATQQPRTSKRTSGALFLLLAFGGSLQCRPEVTPGMAGAGHRERGLVCPQDSAPRVALLPCPQPCLWASALPVSHTPGQDPSVPGDHRVLGRGPGLDKGRGQSRCQSPRITVAILPWLLAGHKLLPKPGNSAVAFTLLWVWWAYHRLFQCPHVSGFHRGGEGTRPRPVMDSLRVQGNLEPVLHPASRQGLYLCSLGRRGWGRARWHCQCNPVSCAASMEGSQSATRSCCWWQAGLHATKPPIHGANNQMSE